MSLLVKVGAFFLSYLSSREQQGNVTLPSPKQRHFFQKRKIKPFWAIFTNGIVKVSPNTTKRSQGTLKSQISLFLNLSLYIQIFLKTTQSRSRYILLILLYIDTKNAYAEKLCYKAYEKICIIQNKAVPLCRNSIVNYITL